jgi:two-component system, cell cycle response regulator
MKTINTAILSSRESRLIKTVISFTKAKQYLFNVAEFAGVDARSLHIVIVSINDESAEAQLTLALQRNPELQVLFVGQEESQVADKTNHILHKKLVSGLVPMLERLADSISIKSGIGPSPTTSATPTQAASPTSSPRLMSGGTPAPVLHLATKQQRERLRALVVDDSPTVRTQLTQTIERMGMSCDAAEGSAIALRILNERNYDVIYVDVVMPDMDGYKLTREIKRDARHKATPVIILTSQSSPFDRARGALAGCDTFLTKPVDVKRFFDATTKVLRKKLAVDDLDDRLVDPTKPQPMPTVPASPAAAVQAVNVHQMPTQLPNKAG